MINLLYHGNQILSITNAVGATSTTSHFVGTGVLDGPIQYKSYFAIDLDCRGRQSLQMYISAALGRGTLFCYIVFNAYQINP